VAKSQLAYFLAFEMLSAQALKIGKKLGALAYPVLHAAAHDSRPLKIF
jgi:hypothetical protein